MKAKIGNRLLTTLQPEIRPFEVRDTDLKGFVLRIQPSGIMTYLCDYRLSDGRRNRYVIGRHGVLTPAQARDHAIEILAEVTKGIDPGALRKQAKRDSLEVFLEQKYGPWIESHRKTGKSLLARINRCFPEFKEKTLGDISAWAVEKWRSDRLKAGIKPSTVNRDLSVLKAALSKAVEWGILDRHPLSQVKPSRVDQKGTVRYLTDDEETRLRFALNKREETIRQSRDQGNLWRRERDYPEFPSLRQVHFVDHIKPLVILSINTGLRRGEFFQLKWENVNLSQRYLTVTGDTAKSGSTRHVPLNNEAFTMLETWRKQSNSPAYGLVFPGKDDMPLTDVKNSWATVLEIARITNFRWHDLRHHFASRLVMAGVDLNTVRELLGHSDLKMTLRYAHLAPKVKADAVARLERTN